ncbi:MAG: hypothetical protein HKN25_04280 [Pyrinomonadaceae bacterium]|nr:hypothetical protein [Pyrinomonadaceae bacterium]
MMQFFREGFSAKIFLSFLIAPLLASASVLAFPFGKSVNISPKLDKLLKEETTRNISNDDFEGEDLGIRRAAVEALGNRAGTVVVMNAQTGRIYTIVNQEWGIRNAFKPCSTIKLVTGIAGYNEKLIRSNGNLVNGYYRLGLDQSLAYSNNTYFQKIGKRLGSRKMIRYAGKLGLGEPTGINSRSETAGRLPFGNENLRIYSHADDFLTSPLQLAVMVSAITNGGDLVVPQIPRNKFQKANFRGYLRRELDLRPTVFERVIPGMMGAVKYGTAKRIRNANLKIAGKTGSCISDNTWVGLFASVAPIQSPKFSVVVITKGKFARGKYSAAIAEKIYRKLRPLYDRPFQKKLRRKPLRVKTPKSKVSDSKNVASIGKPKIITIKSDVAAKPKSKTKKQPRNVARKRVRKNNKKKVKKVEQIYPAVVIGGKQEITRPRVVGNK